MNAHTKQQQDKVFEMDFIDSQKSDPPFAHLLVLNHYIYIYVMVWWSVEQDSEPGSGRGLSKWRPQQAATANRLLFYSSRQLFSAHPKSSLARIDKRTVRAAGNTRYRYNEIGPLDHKMADNCVSLARTNTVSSPITKPIKTWKTSNESYSYNLLNHRNKMYTHDLFNLQQEWEAWLAPV